MMQLLALLRLEKANGIKVLRRAVATTLFTGTFRTMEG